MGLPTLVLKLLQAILIISCLHICQNRTTCDVLLELNVREHSSHFRVGPAMRHRPLGHHTSQGCRGLRSTVRSQRQKVSAEPGMVHR